MKESNREEASSPEQRARRNKPTVPGRTDYTGKEGICMPDYGVKITETENEELRHHHYLITAKDEREAKKLALKFIEHFIDDDENPDKITDGYSFYNHEISVQLSGIKETTKEQFKDFLLKTHTINLA